MSGGVGGGGTFVFILKTLGILTWEGLKLVISVAPDPRNIDANM